MIQFQPRFHPSVALHHLKGKANEYVLFLEHILLFYCGSKNETQALKMLNRCSASDPCPGTKVLAFNFNYDLSFINYLEDLGLLRPHISHTHNQVLWFSNQSLSWCFQWKLISYLFSILFHYNICKFEVYFFSLFVFCFAIITQKVMQHLLYMHTFRTLWHSLECIKSIYLFT